MKHECQFIKSTMRERGFTLVEILVVLAVLGILAALLLPVFNRVRENDRKLVCQNNLKQLGIAVQQYAADNDGRFPDSFIDQLAPYMKSVTWFECPTHKALSQPKDESYDPKDFLIFGYNYNGTRLTTAPADFSRFSGQHEAAIPNATTTWVFGDERLYISPMGFSFVGMTLAYDHCEIPDSFGATYHNEGGNYVFLDGHVKWFTPTAIQKLHCAN